MRHKYSGSAVIWENAVFLQLCACCAMFAWMRPVCWTRPFFSVFGLYRKKWEPDSVGMINHNSPIITNFFKLVKLQHPICDHGWRVVPFRFYRCKHQQSSSISYSTWAVHGKCCFLPQPLWYTCQLKLQNWKRRNESKLLYFSKDYSDYTSLIVILSSTIIWIV